MMVRKKIVISAVFLVIILLLVQAVGGIFNLFSPLALYKGQAESVVSADDSGTVSFITGQWLFTSSDKLESPFPINTGEMESLPSHSPGRRSGDGLGIFSPSTGIYLYYAKIHTRNRRGAQALLIPQIFSACTLWVNGEEVYVSGTPGDSYDTEVPGVRLAVAGFNQETDDLEIVLQVTNHHYFYDGFLFNGLGYGGFNEVSRLYTQFRGIIRFLLLFLIGLVVFYSIRTVFLRSDKYHYFLTIIFLLILVRLSIGDAFIFGSSEIESEFLWTVILKARLILALLSVPLLLHFSFNFYTVFSSYRRIAIISQIAALSVSVAVIFVPGKYLHHLYPLEISAFLIGAVICIIIGIRGVKLRGALSGLFLAVASLSLIINFYHIVYIYGIFDSIELFVGGSFLLFSAFLLLIFLRELRYLRQTDNIKQKLVEVTDSRDSILIKLSDEVSLDKITSLTTSLIQGSLGPLNSEQLVTTSLLLSNTMRHQNLLNDIIDLVRLREKNLTIVKDSINLFSVAHLHINSFQPVILGLSVDIENTIPRDLPNVWADSKRLGQILFTILSFGIENTTKGTIRITAAREDSSVKIIISVCGIDKTEKLQDQLDSLAKNDESGSEAQKKISVLRFFLTQELVRLHGSNLSVKTSTDEEDVVFSFSLPIFVAGEEEAFEIISEEMAIHMDALENLQPLMDEVSSERDITIFVVSSDPENLQVIKSQLASMNYQIIPILKGSDLLKKLEEKIPNMVIIDSSLSDISSFEACRVIRAEFSSTDLPVLLVIEESSTADVMESLTAGANDYLRRPYQLEEFLTRVNTHLQLSRINSIYSQFVPREFLKALGQENITDLKLGDQVHREMTILFVDIRAFTNLSETMTPQENFKFINSYLSQFSPIITRNNGFVDKFIGDAIMALYPDKPEDAIRTAIEMTEYVKIYNGYRANCGYDPINIGIGIHTGKMILGIVGDSQRMQGTVISDAVNLASRIQDVTKLYKTNVVISQETFVTLENPTEFNFRFLGKVKVKGKNKSVALFEIFNADEEETRELKETTKGEFESAILLFAKREFLEAAELFEKVLEVYPDDKTASLFLDRANKFLITEKKSFLTSL